MLLPKLTASLVALFIILDGYAQTGRQKLVINRPATKHYFFSHITASTGLSSYQVNSTVQDQEGYIWMATNDGLQRHDGIRFKTFRHSDEDSSSLPSNFIWQVLIDKLKNLWIFTIDGRAGIFNTKTFKFSPALIRSANESLLTTNTLFKAIIPDEFGNLFMLVPGSELITYNKKENAFAAEYNFSALKRKLKVKTFLQQPGTNNYWLYAEGIGLALYNHSSGKLSYPGNNTEYQNAINQLNTGEQVVNLFFDKKGRFWVIYDNGDNPSVSCFDLKKNAFILNKYHFERSVLGYHEIRTMYEQKDGSIWMIGQKVFAKYLEDQKQFEQVYNGYEQEHGIDYHTITCLMEDREKNMWVSTANNGIFRFNPSNDFFQNARYVSHTTNQPGGGGPLSFIRDHDGSFLVGIREEGFYRFNKNLEQVPLNIKGIPDKNSTVIWDMCASQDSNFIWMATKNGIYKYDVHKKSAVFFQPSLLHNKTARRITEDNKGKLWIGTQEAGLFTWDPGEGKLNVEDGLNAIAGIPSVRINRLIKDRLGFIWAATTMAGAFMIDPASDNILLHFSLQSAGNFKLPEQSVHSILDYSDSIIILGTNTRLFSYNRILKTTRPFGRPLSGFISSMEKDSDGYLWVSTTTSIYRITFANKVLLQMDRNDGLENDFFLMGSSLVLPDKRMLFGVYGAIVNFLPSAILTSPMVPDLKITGFMVKDKALQVDSLLKLKTIVLPPEQNSLVIDLSVLSYNSGYLLKSKMEGLDTGWKIIDRNNQLVYSYLPPGFYKLKVETVDAEGKTGARNLQINIRITPPFWQTWWFYCALLLIGLLILYWLDKQKTSRWAAFQRMRSNIAGNLHREVNIALNNINILSEMARLKADNNPEKAKEFIGQIHIKSEQMITAMDDMVWSIDPVNDSMQKTLERLREFIETLNNGQGADIEMQVDDNVANLRLDMQLRHDAMLLIKDNIQTQVKCGGKNIIVHISYEKSHLVYGSQFNTAACDVKQLNNFLYSKEMTNRLTAIPAILEVDINKSDMLVLLKFSV